MLHIVCILIFCWLRIKFWENDTKAIQILNEANNIINYLYCMLMSTFCINISEVRISEVLIFQESNVCARSVSSTKIEM